MKLLNTLVVLVFFTLFSCTEKNRWDIDLDQTDDVAVEIKNVSDAFYNTSLDNTKIKEQFPELFANAKDSALTASRRDTVMVNLNKKVAEKYGDPQFLNQKISPILRRLHHYYPQMKDAVVYSFTGEMEFPEPVVFNPLNNHLAIGLDWFMGQDFPYYENAKIPQYFRKNMNEENLEPAIVEAIAEQVVPRDFRNRKFIEKIIYEGKKMLLQDVLLPDVEDHLKIGYTEEELDFAKENAGDIYTYFAENELFFSDNTKLDERFINKAAFSKFYGADDRKTPGRLGVWLGWQIVRSYLDKHPDVKLIDFLAENDLQKIFNESGYKP